MKKRSLVSLMPLLMVFANLLFSPNTSAVVPNSVKYKAAYEGVYQCLFGGAYETSFMASKGGAGILLKELSEDIVKLPYGLTNAKDNNTNCKQILKGFSDKTNSNSDNLRAGLMQPGIWSSKDTLAVKNYFAGYNGQGGDGSMGYSAQGAGNIKNDQKISKLTVTLDRERINGETCRQKVDKSTTVAGIQSFYNSNGDQFNELIFPTITKDNTGNWFFGDVASSSKGINVPEPGSGGSVLYNFCNNDSYVQIMDNGVAKQPSYAITVSFTEYRTNAWGEIESFTDTRTDDAAFASGENGWDFIANSKMLKGDTSEGAVEDTGDFDDYKLTYLTNGTLDQAKATLMRTIVKLDRTNAAGYSLNLASHASYVALALNGKEIYSLYTYYVKDVFQAPVLCEGENGFDLYNDSNSKIINWSSGKECRVDIVGSKTPQYSVYGVSDSGGSKNHFVKEVSLDDVITTLNLLPDNISETVDSGETGGTMPDGVIAPDGTVDDGPEPGNSDPCSDGAGALGWFLCPAINLMSNTVQGIYDDYIKQNFMEVKAEWLDTSSQLYTQGWAKFRNYANITFAILLLIVILSQVTGLFITNYGIKKMLPRLVIVVMLINLSFFICQLAVDVSNILGYSIQDVLAKMGVDFTRGASTSGSVLADILSIGGITAAGASVGAWIVPLLLALLSGLISVVFAGIVLGVRQAGVLILVVISPLAFACYALDGTKPLFDKWKKLFINLLVVFPVCGILMGGGIFASDLLLSISTGFFMQLVAMLLRVVPFFFIPTLVKGALAALGNIGTKIGMFGRGLRGSATRAAKGSGLYQHADAAAGMLHGRAMMGTKRVIGKGIRKLPGGNALANKKFGQFMGRLGNRRIAQYAQKEYNLAASDAAANALSEGGFLDAERRSGIEAAAIRKANDQRDEEQQALFRNRLGEMGIASDTTLTNELRKIQADLDKKPQDATLQSKIRALTKFMLDFDDGRGALMKEFHRAMSNSPNSATAQTMNNFLQRGENVGTIKQSGQRGFQALLQDIAQRQGIKSLAQYAAEKADKPDANTVGRIDSSFLKAQLEAIANNNSFDTLTDNDKAGISDWLRLYQDAMNNPHTKGGINKENRDLMTAITEKAAERGIQPTLEVTH